MMQYNVYIVVHMLIAYEYQGLRRLETGMPQTLKPKSESMKTATAQEAYLFEGGSPAEALQAGIQPDAPERSELGCLPADLHRAG